MKEVTVKKIKSFCLEAFFFLICFLALDKLVFGDERTVGQSLFHSICIFVGAKFLEWLFAKIVKWWKTRN